MAKVNKTFQDGQPLTAADMNAINSAAGAVGNATTTAELASVVAGNFVKGELKSDANDINTSIGFWAIEDLATNVKYKIGGLLHFNLGRTSTSSLQINFSSTNLAFRTKNNGQWSQWIVVI